VTRTRILLALAVALLVGVATLLGGALRGGSSPAPAGAASTPAAASAFTAGFSLNESTAVLVTQLQAGLRADPQNGHGYALLGLAYEQRARETGDPTYYTKAQGVLARALQLQPHDLVATSGLGSLALSRHQFARALRIGRETLRLSPTTASSYGIVGDAEIELGRYRQAFKDFDTMARLKPDVAAYARVAYARELLGNQRGAVTAMKLAVDAALDEREPTAWTHWQLGKLHWMHGQLRAAAREYRFALQVFPGYVYALDALAQVEAARKHYAAAIADERQAVNGIPLPQFVATLGDLYRVTGKEKPARDQYRLIGVIDRLLRANGVSTDLEIAQFDADHGVAPARTLALARVAQAERPSIDGDDVLAWSLQRNERCAEALRYSKLALRLGTQDALKFFHRGMIERCLGNTAAARSWFRRALELNPHFSILWAPVARKLAE
jgi:tetratricopeptide (TPR) repeat protein